MSSEINQFLSEAKSVAIAACQYRDVSMERVRICARNKVHARLVKFASKHPDCNVISAERSEQVIDGIASAAWAMVQQWRLAQHFEQWPPNRKTGV